MKTPTTLPYAPRQKSDVSGLIAEIRKTCIAPIGEHIDRSLATFTKCPPQTRYQEGYEAALKEVKRFVDAAPNAALDGGAAPAKLTEDKRAPIDRAPRRRPAVRSLKGS